MYLGPNEAAGGVGNWLMYDSQRGWVVCLNYIRGRELTQTSRRDAVFGSAKAADGRNKCSDLGIHSTESFFQ